MHVPQCNLFINTQLAIQTVPRTQHAGRVYLAVHGTKHN